VSRIKELKYEIEYKGYIPSVDNMYNYGRGRVYLNKDVKQFKDDLMYTFLEKYTKNPSASDYYVEIFAGGLRGGRDVQNITKAIFDAFEGLTYFNDKQVEDYYVKRIKEKILKIYFYEYK